MQIRMCATIDLDGDRESIPLFSLELICVWCQKHDYSDKELSEEILKRASNFCAAVKVSTGAK